MVKEKKQIIEQRDLLISQIKEYCPIVKPFFELDMKLSDYSDFLYNFEVDKIHLQRQWLVKNKIKNKLNKLFGINYEKELVVNLNGGLAINIADHHQIMNHPFLISSNIIGNTNKLLQSTKQEVIIVLSSGDVPPNNYFSKNGFMLHGKKVPLFSNSEKELTSYYIPKRDFDFIKKSKLADKWKDFSNEEQVFLKKEYEKIKSFDFSKCENYSDQISIVVKNIWPYMFEKKLRSNLPELLYLTQEEITTDCLIDLLEDDNNIITKSLFDNDFRDAVLNNFRGNVVTWREKKQKGTHFFWRKYPNSNKSLRMYLEGNKLVPADERFKDYFIRLNKDDIVEALKKKEIYPNLFLIFSVLNFYAGIKPLVGYGSLLYLHLMKQTWIKTLKEFNLDNEMKLVEQVQTNGFTAGLAIFFKRFDKRLKALYAYDIFYEGGMSEEYLKTILDMRFGEILSVGAADVYDYYSQKYIPKEKQIKSKINFDDLSQLVFDWL